MINKAEKFIIYALVFCAGFVLGSFLVVDVQPRSYLAVRDCENCWTTRDIAGLVVSAGITNVSEFIPDVVMETDKTVVINHPFPQLPVHLVILPKKDIKDIADITPADEEYVVDAMNVAGELIRKYKLENYRLITNGPGYQSVRYLHFHLVSK